MISRDSERSETGVRTKVRWLAALSTLALVWINAPTTAGAGTSCGFTSNEVHIVMSDTATVVRSGDDILVDGAACGGATVTSTSLISFYDNFGGNSQTGTISLAGGPFSPGLDTGPSPDISFYYEATLNICDRVAILGSPGADFIRWGGLFNGVPISANLNANEVADVEADLTASGNCVRPASSGGAGDDVLSAAGGAGTGSAAHFWVNLDGGPGDDVVVGGWNQDVLLGGSGSDTINGGDAPDRLQGGDGSDRLVGGSGDDKLYGEAGRDTLLGGPGNDFIIGGPGFDTCRGGPGVDRFSGCEVKIQ